MNAVALVGTVIIIMCVFFLGLSFGVNAGSKKGRKEAEVIAKIAGESTAAHIALQKSMVNAMEDMAHTGTPCKYCAAFAEKSDANKNCSRCKTAASGLPGFVSMYRRRGRPRKPDVPKSEERIDCLLCGAERSVAVTHEPTSGHMRGVCEKCGARYME